MGLDLKELGGEVNIINTCGMKLSKDQLIFLCFFFHKLYISK